MATTSRPGGRLADATGPVPVSACSTPIAFGVITFYSSSALAPDAVRVQTFNLSAGR
jgi:hypothetical protein